MTNKLKYRMTAVFYATVSIFTGAGVIYFGDKLLGTNLALFYGVSTFSPIWVISLIAIPFVGGFVVSLIYGLGGQLLAYMPAIIVHGMAYYEFYANPALLPAGVSLLPIGYWILIMIVAVEACGIGGIVGEVMVKKTYGRSDKRKLHKKYQKQSRV